MVVSPFFGLRCMYEVCRKVKMDMRNKSTKRRLSFRKSMLPTIVNSDMTPTKGDNKQHSIGVFPSLPALEPPNVS